MKTLLILVMLLSFTSIATAGYVKGYYRSNGTYVNGHYRSNPNSTVKDNYSYKGNYNPYTRESGTDYYRNDDTSDYYEGNDYYIAPVLY